MKYMVLDTSTPLQINAEKNSRISSILERALNRLRIKKGAFVLDPTLGSELYKLTGITNSQLSSRALNYVKEALAPIYEITVLGVLAKPEGDVLNLTISMEIDDTETSVLVSV